MAGPVADPQLRPLTPVTGGGGDPTLLRRESSDYLIFFKLSDLNTRPDLSVCVQFMFFIRGYGFFLVVMACDHVTGL
jgi:hypothetical protein